MPDQTSLADLADTLPETLRAQVLSQLGGSGTEAPWTRYQGAAAPSEASGASDVEDGPWSQYAHTDDLDVPVADTNSGVWATALEAGRRGLRESLTDTTHAVDPFTDRAAEAYDANDHVSNAGGASLAGSPALAALDCSTATPYRLRTVF